MVRLAPLSVPLARRKQTAVVLLYLTAQLLCLFLTLFLTFAPFFFPSLRWIVWPIFFPYLFWIFFIDKHSSCNGKGRPFPALKRSTFWLFLRDYFPAKLHKEGDLDPKKNYIFGYHPHGIISFGAWINFATDANDFSGLYPGIRLRVLTLEVNFRIPFFRDYILAMDLNDVTAGSIRRILNSGPGSSCLIVVGGAQEALDARPGVHDLTLKNRKGFVKMAITNGAHLVPVFSFGENDVYDQVENPEGSTVRKWQHFLKNKLGFSLPLIKGRGIFNYDFGLLPQRFPINTVVGKPIPVEKVENPTKEQIDELHEKYVQGLTELYNKYKDNFAPQRKKSLMLVD
eukprot:TRINITY_DN3034_c0_g1_i1.p1 TRINITY_DN3034_c0_g1~~TRINITY_DN3034_c0_g1_i1.p1  ORF type:complete len:342 (-),score=81.81 TRINITY_DN3034_c0_g1_i1:200-1225(-)